MKFSHLNELKTFLTIVLNVDLSKLTTKVREYASINDHKYHKLFF